MNKPVGVSVNRITLMVTFALWLSAAASACGYGPGEPMKSTAVNPTLVSQKTMALPSATETVAFTPSLTGTLPPSPTGTLAPNTWRAVGPGGESINDLAVDPITPTTLYAAAGGGLYKSMDGGGNWSALDTGMTEPRVTYIAIDPITPTTLYVGTYKRGLLKSVDGGGRWTSTGFEDSAVHDLVVDPSTPGTVYVSVDEGVYKTTDSGDTWYRSDNGLRKNISYTALAVDPVTPTTVYAGSGWEDKVYISTDGGGSWRESKHEQYGGEISFLAVDPLTTTTVYAGVTNFYLKDINIFKSTDGGGTWNSSGAGFPAKAVLYEMAIDPISPANLYLATGDGVYKSVDGGANWLNFGPPGIAINDLAIDPARPDTLYAGSGRGVYKSTNSGGTWSEANTGMVASLAIRSLAIDPGASSTIYVGTEIYGFFKSTDGGGTWVPSASPTAQYFFTSFAIDPKTPTTLYAGTYQWGILKSTDGGDTWSEMNNGLPVYKFADMNQPVVGLVINPADPGTLYTAIDRRGVFKTWNAGGNWINVNNGLPEYPVLRDLAIDPLFPAVLYVGTPQSGVYKTTGGGGYWYQIRYGMTTEADRRISALAVHPVVTSTLYAGGFDGRMFKSTDSGESWIAVNNGLPESTWITDIAVDPKTSGIVYVGTWNYDEPSVSGVYKSTNGGESWTCIGLPGGGNYYFAIDPVTPTTLYVGTRNGLYVIHQIPAE